MPTDKKPAKATSKTAKSDKPVIVTHRPILKGPGAEAAETGQEQTVEAAPAKENLAHTTGPKLQPLSEPPAEEPKTTPPEPEPPKAQPQPKPEPEPKAETSPKPKPPTEQKQDVEAARKKEQAAAVEKLIESGKYRLPINAVEKRKAQHFVILGFLLAALLILVWIDVALDAGLIKMGGIKPVTHFFSN